MKKLNRKNKQRRKGSTILATVIFLFIGFAISAVTIRDAIFNGRMVNEQISMERAHYHAEAGIEEAADLVTNWTGYFPKKKTNSYPYANGGSFECVITKDGWNEFSFESVGTFGGNTRTISILRAYYPTFAAFSMWTHDFRDLWYTPGYIAEGHVHSDSRINIWSSASAGGPHFKGKVTTGHDSFGGWPEYATYDEGYEFDSYQGDLQSIDFSEMKGEALEHGEVFRGPTEIYYDVNNGGNGIMYVKNADRWSDNSYHPIHTDGTEVVYIEDTTTTESYYDRRRRRWRTRTVTNPGSLTLNGGELKGAMTIFAENDVTVQNHMVYHNDPSDDGEIIRDFIEPSNDRLGVISKDDIWIGTSAPNHLQLFGAYLAAGRGGSGSDANGEMGVLNYNDYNRGFRGYINQYGSKITDRTYPAGVFNSATGQPLAGYRTNTTYDERFLNNPPPFYPPISAKLIFEDWVYGAIDEQ